jgi:hypothetical protein
VDPLLEVVVGADELEVKKGAALVNVRAPFEIVVGESDELEDDIERRR